MPQTAEYQKEWARRNPEKVLASRKRWEIRNVERRKEYRLLHRDERRKLQKNWSLLNPEKIKQYELNGKTAKAATRKLYRHKHPEIPKAQSAVLRAVATGKIIRPKNCSKCGIECTPQGHHYRGYDYEHRLDVIWLCRPCHSIEHRKP